MFSKLLSISLPHIVYLSIYCINPHYQLCYQQRELISGFVPPVTQLIPLLSVVSRGTLEGTTLTGA